MIRSFYYQIIQAKTVLMVVFFVFYHAIFTALCPLRSVLAQDLDLIMETISPEDFDDIAEFEAYFEGMLDLFPVEINSASMDELLLVPGLTAHMARAIIAYREDQSFTKLEDLVNIRGIGPVTLDQLSHWITVQHSGNRRTRWLENMGSEQFFRFQQSFPSATGYQSNRGTSPNYPGSPNRLYHRQHVTSARISANLTQVKLPGEPYRSPTGFDFTSANLSVYNTGPVKRLIAGDFAARFGQGLVLWSSPTFGKGSLAHSAPFRRSHGITPYRSSGQINFLRGLAAEFFLPLPSALRSKDTELTLSGFYSRRNRSAVEVRGDTIRPPSSNPYHRTETELMRRNNTLEFVQGGNFNLKYNRLSMGFTWMSYGLNRPVLTNPGASRYQGSDHRSMGADFIIDSEMARLFGEYAWRIGNSANGTDLKKLSYQNKLSHQQKNAWMVGAMGAFRDGVDWVFSVRSYQPGYWSEFAGGFGEGIGVPSNQNGWYFGFRLRPSSRVVIQGFLDRFHFPQPRRGFTRPSSGWETMINLHYRHRPGFHYQFRMRYKERGIELEASDAFLRTWRMTGTNGRFTGRVQMNWQLNKMLFIRSQYDIIQTTRSDSSDKTGFAIGKVVRVKPWRSLRLDLGWSFFDTDDFSARLYLYEYDLTNVMSSNMAYGTGRRSYAVLRYQPIRWMLVETKIGYVQYSDRPAVGSGYDMTPGPSRSEAGVQLRFQY